MSHSFVTPLRPAIFVHPLLHNIIREVNVPSIIITGPPTQNFDGRIWNAARCCSGSIPPIRKLCVFKLRARGKLMLIKAETYFLVTNSPDERINSGPTVAPRYTM